MGKPSLKANNSNSKKGSVTKPSAVHNATSTSTRAFAKGEDESPPLLVPPPALDDEAIFNPVVTTGYLATKDLGRLLLLTSKRLRHVLVDDQNDTIKNKLPPSSSPDNASSLSRNHKRPRPPENNNITNDSNNNNAVYKILCDSVWGAHKAAHMQEYAGLEAKACFVKLAIPPSLRPPAKRVRQYEPSEILLYNYYIQGKE